MTTIYWEDFEPGSELEMGRHTFTEAAITSDPAYRTTTVSE